MFVSHDIISPKKKIQKPNILRRKTKATNLSYLACESLSSGKSVLSQELRVEDPPKKLKPIQVLKLNTTMKSHEVFEDAAHDTDETDLNPQEFYVDNFYSLKDFNEDISKLGNVVIEKDLETSEKPKWMEFINNKTVVKPCDVESIYIETAPETSTKVVPISSITILNTSNFNSEDMESSSTNKLKCDIDGCDKEFSSEQKLKKHKSLHNKDGTIKPQRQITIECPVKEIREDGSEKSCGRIFKVREDLSKHLNEEHTPDEAAYKCTECSRSFFWATGLRAHSRSHVRRPALACSYAGCGRVFRQPCRLREHQRAHTGDKPYPCQYPGCGWSFRTASKLLRHARRHTGERRHPCAECGTAFLRREHLRDHVARYHAPRPPRRACTAPDCQRTFTNMSSLYKHMKRVHRQEQNLSSTDETSEVLEEKICIPGESKNMFMISLYPECELVTPAEVEQCVVEQSVDDEEHAARTHCTWPLERTHVYTHTEEQEVDANAMDAQAMDVHAIDANAIDAHVIDAHAMDANAINAHEMDIHAIDAHAIDAHAMDAHAIDEDAMDADAHALDEHEEIVQDVHAEIAHDAFVLGEDVHVEQCEGAESNSYTIRSDLFLHGNVIHNEDSEHMSRAPPLDADLLDAPSVDIAQEELYSDAVDESSFRVFLLSAEELAVAE
ncbi:zinc finger protein 76-like isoform X2 [Aricia agestis]|uniref:zinc finger protein 76-like isoform X2 n=1 Tax=Aricia agestis TaxID=91739 RepID=UPI001C20337C|nr:zinc finger protein 76-like isoform X2 [Aricia agestis]